MNGTLNEIHSLVASSLKSPIDAMNLTKPQAMTSETTPSVLEHVATTDLRNVHDIYSRLGYGDLSNAVTQMMLCSIVVGLLLFILIACIFIRQIPHIIQHTPTKYLARTLTLCGVYTIVGAAALVSLIAYRAYVFCDSICHFAFLLCAYQYFTLAIDYVDGESNFIKSTKGMMVFNLQTPPICCCLYFLLPTAITKEKFKVLRIMVLQMVIIQGTLLALLNIFNLIDTQLYDVVQPFVTIFIVSSIFVGVWSLQITSRMIAKHLPEHKIMQKYFSIQLVLILYKFQPALINGLCYVIQSTSDYRITNKIVSNAAVQLIILLETAFLSFFANRAYNVPTKEFQPN